MSENNIKHFETLWEEAETLADKKYKTMSTPDLIKKISELFNFYSESVVDSAEITESIKTKYLGEIVFIITSISLRDNINVYAALKEQTILNNID